MTGFATANPLFVAKERTLIGCSCTKHPYCVSYNHTISYQPRFITPQTLTSLQLFSTPRLCRLFLEMVNSRRVLNDLINCSFHICENQVLRMPNSYVMSSELRQARATSATTFLVVPGLALLLFKIDNAASI